MTREEYTKAYIAEQAEILSIPISDFNEFGDRSGPSGFGMCEIKKEGGMIHPLHITFDGE